MMPQKLRLSACFCLAQYEEEKGQNKDKEIRYAAKVLIN